MAKVENEETVTEGLNELEIAQMLLSQVLLLHQYGAVGEDSQGRLDTMIEHFLRRDEPESACYGKFTKES